VLGVFDHVQGTDAWNFYLAFAFFRVAAIVQVSAARVYSVCFCASSTLTLLGVCVCVFQGVYVRWSKGQASASNAEAVGLLAPKFAEVQDLRLLYIYLSLCRAV
jgi:hypothetical protein